MFVSSIQHLLPYYNTKKRSRNGVLSLSLFFTVSSTNNMNPNNDYHTFSCSEIPYFNIYIYRVFVRNFARVIINKFNKSYWQCSWVQ